MTEQEKIRLADSIAVGIFFGGVLFCLGMAIFATGESGTIKYSSKAIVDTYPYSLGYMSNRSGVPANGNPYTGNVTMSREWLKGWVAGNLEGR